MLGLAGDIEELVEGAGRERDAEAAKEALRKLVKMVRLLPSAQLRCLVVWALLSHELQLLPSADDSLPSRRTLLLAALAPALGNSAEQKPVAEMLRQLPAAVLGSAALREETRVLVDLAGDAEASARNERGRVVRKYTAQTLELVDTVADNVRQLLGNGAFLALLAAILPDCPPLLSPDALSLVRARLIVALMSQISPPDRHRLFVRLAILSRAIPHDPLSRDQFLSILFPSLSSTLSSSSTPSTSNSSFLS